MKSSDIIIAESGDIILIEVVAKRLNLMESVLRLSPEAIARDIEAAVLKKARQLHRNISDFRAGRLMPDLPRRYGQRFFPIIVAPHDGPRISTIATHLERARVQNGLLFDVEPLELLDVGEIEQLEIGLRKGLSLCRVLDRKNGSTPEFRMMSMHNYLIYGEPGTISNEASPSRDRGSAVAQEIIDLARSWIDVGMSSPLSG